MNNSNNTTVCRYYLRGICRFGDMCRFSHHTLSNENEINETIIINEPTDATQDNSISILNVKAKPFVPMFNTSYNNININSSSSHNDDDEDDDIHDDDNASTQNLEPTLMSTIERKSYAEVVGGAASSGGGGGVDSEQAQSSSVVLCPYEGDCPYGEYCGYLHPEYCDMCCQYRLHPTDKEQRRKHKKECIQRHEKDMELSFAVARSQDKTCGVCFDLIMEKSGREQRFGILPNCNHVFCLECIRKWRQAKQFEHKITRACPECRTPSDYVCPSAYWVETKEEKEKLLNDYKAALGEKDCKYFKKGEGKCPFGNKCFYKHALPNGVKVDVGLPQRHIRKIQRTGEEILDLFDIYLWDFVEQRNMYWFTLDHASDSDTDSSDYD